MIFAPAFSFLRNYLEIMSKEMYFRAIYVGEVSVLESFRFLWGVWAYGPREDPTREAAGSGLHAGVPAQWDLLPHRLTRDQDAAAGRSTRHRR